MEGLNPASRRDRIEAGRIALRRARPDDVDMFHAAMRDPAVMHYWSTPPHSEFATTRDWLDGMISADPATSDDFVIEVDGRIVGSASSLIVDSSSHSEWHNWSAVTDNGGLGT